MWNQEDIWGYLIDFCKGFINLSCSPTNTYHTEVFQENQSNQIQSVFVCFFSVSSVLLKDVFSVLSSAGSAPEAKFTGTQILLKYCCQECEINYLQCRRSLSVINCNSNGKLSRKKKTSGGELGRFAVKCHTLVHLVFSLTTDLFREHLQQSSWVVISRHLKCWQEGFIQRIKWVLDGGVDC